MRKRFKAFGRGKIEFLESENTKALAFVRTYNEEKILIVANLSRYAQAATVEMQSLKDLIPVEVFSQNKFPKIGKKPYSFTLSPYGYYWFKLVEDKQNISIIPINSDTVLDIKKWSDLVGANLKDKTKNDILLPYLKNQLWFNVGKRKIEFLKIFDVIPVNGKQHNFEGFTLILEVTFFEGLYEKYRLVVGFTRGKEEKMLLSDHPDSVIARIIFNGKNGILFDASYSDGYRKTLFQLLKRNSTITTDTATVKFLVSDELKTLLENPALEKDNKLVDSRFRHVIIQYNKKFIVKLYRKIDRGTDRDVEICNYLCKVKNFNFVPQYLGQIEYTKKDDIKRTLAIIQEYVPNYGTASHYFSDALNRFYERVSIHGGAIILPPIEGSLNKPLKFEQMSVANQELIGGAHIEHIRLLAQRTAEMHVALGTDWKHQDFEPEEFSLHYQRSLFSGYKSSIRNTYDLITKYIGEFPPNHQEEINVLIGLKDALIQKMQQIYDHKIDAVKIRPHGFYTLDSILFQDGDFVITNFEGDPTFSLTERRLRKSPLTDLAAMLNSFHYVAYSALLQNEPSGRLAEHWFHSFSQIFISNYKDLVDGQKFIPIEADFNMLLEIYQMDRYLNDIAKELSQRNRKNAIIPIRGILKVMRKSFIYKK
jgi:maltose alpha-D-glucosyltransferase/alpha-amylase